MYRLFEIIYLLLHKGRMTAGELADHFEVSQRTIYRDVERLSQNGVPVYMERGVGGGISLMKGYQLERGLLSEAEQQTLIASLESLAPLATKAEEELLVKIAAQFQHPLVNWLVVDPEPWGEKGTWRFELLKEGILTNRIVSFDYLNASGSFLARKAEPYQLRFKGQNWYLRAYDLEKGWRLFKLTRMQELRLGDNFQPKAVPAEEAGPAGSVEEICFTVKQSSAFRVMENYPQEQIQQLPSGDFRVTVTWPLDQWVVSHLLSYGSELEVLSPDSLREAVTEELRKMTEIYQPNMT